MDKDEKKKRGGKKNVIRGVRIQRETFHPKIRTRDMEILPSRDKRKGIGRIRRGNKIYSFRKVGRASYVHKSG